MLPTFPTSPHFPPRPVGFHQLPGCLHSHMGVCGSSIHVCLGSWTANSMKAGDHVCLAHPTATLPLAHGFPEHYLPEAIALSTEPVLTAPGTNSKDSPFQQRLSFLIRHTYLPLSTGEPSLSSLCSHHFLHLSFLLTLLMQQ